MKMAYDSGHKFTNGGARDGRLIAPLVGLIMMGFAACAHAGDLIVDGNLSVNSNLTVSGSGGITVGPIQISTNLVTIAVRPGDSYNNPTGGTLTIGSVTQDVGGDITMAAGDYCGGLGQGGHLILKGGMGQVPGDVRIYSGEPWATSGSAGQILMTASGSYGSGGNVNVTAGSGYLGGGGSISLDAGDSDFSGGGTVTLQAGRGGTDWGWGEYGYGYNGGSVVLISGEAGNTNVIGGDIELTAVDGGDVEITGREVRLTGVVRVPAAGDISMGAFTNGPAQ